MFDDLVAFLRNWYDDPDLIPLHAPLFGKSDRDYVLRAIDSTYVSSVGEFGERFEEQVCRLTGAPAAVVTGSGTASTALFMTSATATGESLNAAPLFASLQLSASAHAGVASLPIIAILLTALPTLEANDKYTAVTIGLALGTIWLLLVIASGVVQITITR